MSSLLLLNKPFDVLCQFTDGGGRRTLAELVDVPGVYPAGRLDRDSEGLVLLTDDGALQHRVSHPRHKLAKRYVVQVDGTIGESDVARLADGVALADGPARAVRAAAIDPPEWLWPRDPPVRYRARIPTSWIELVLDEGRNRQVRRMTAAVGHPTLRLVRIAIGPFVLDGLPPGRYRSVSPDALPTIVGAARTRHPRGSGGGPGDSTDPGSRLDRERRRSTKRPPRQR